MLARLTRLRWLPIAVSLLLTAVPVAAYLNRTLDRLEADVVDSHFAIRGDTERPRAVVVAAFDPQTINELNLRWPPQRRLHAQVIDELHRLGARVIAYDLQFTSPTKEFDDFKLYDAAKRAHNLVFSTTEVDAGGHTRVLGGDANLRAIGAVAANTHFPPDSDGVIRRFTGEVEGLPTFAVRVGERMGKTPGAGDFGARGAWIAYSGGTGHVPRVSVVDLIKHRVPRSQIAGKAVVVGATSSVLQDIHATPTSATMPGPEIQANAIDTVLRGFPIKSAPEWLGVLLIVLMGIAPALFAFLLRRSLAIAATGLVLVVYVVATQVAFDNGTVLPLLYPVLAWMLGATAGVGGAYIQASRERDRLRQQFADFDPAIVDAVLAVQAGADEAIALDPESVIAGYRVERVIGRGGMGVVYEATQLSLERLVALKLIRPVFSENSVARERFKRESKLAASVEHPNVIPVYEAGEYEGVLYIAMRLVEGQDLASIISLGAVDPWRAAHLLVQVAAALDAAHAAGLVHRDVKPGNILIAADEAGEHAYLTDFGLTKRLDTTDSLTTPGRFIGTLDYMSPEQIRGANLSAASDIYSLGCVLHHMIVGRPPFDEQSDADVLAAHLNSDPPRLPAALRPIDYPLARAMAKDPDDRFANATAFALAVNAALAELDPADFELAPEPVRAVSGAHDTQSATAPGFVEP